MDRKQGVLERLLFDASAEPADLSVSLLLYIMNDLSDDQRIGRGQVSTVCKRLLRNRIVASKELNETLGILENKFNEEVGCSMKQKHKNIVWFLGYCSDTRGITIDYDGTFFLLERRNCSEIIKGICEGLYHPYVKRCIVRLDLKPANILLDDNMVPKIADFDLLSGYMAPEFFDGEITSRETYIVWVLLFN
ncbi:unnamed protein product [Alopecurus aequalis]